MDDLKENFNDSTILNNLFKRVDSQLEPSETISIKVYDDLFTKKEKLEKEVKNLRSDLKTSESLKNFAENQETKKNEIALNLSIEKSRLEDVIRHLNAKLLEYQEKCVCGITYTDEKEGVKEDV